VADADEFLREHVQEVPPDKFFDPQRHYALLILVRGVAPAEADLALFQPHQPVIGNGDAARVIAEILELTDIRDYGRGITRKPACTGGEGCRKALSCRVGSRGAATNPL